MALVERGEQSVLELGRQKRVELALELEQVGLRIERGLDEVTGRDWVSLGGDHGGRADYMCGSVLKASVSGGYLPETSLARSLSHVLLAK
jgi:hypothetical protein